MACPIELGAVAALIQAIYGLSAIMIVDIFIQIVRKS